MMKFKLLYDIFILRWMKLAADKSTERYRERKDDSDEEEDVKPVIKFERDSPCEEEANAPEDNSVKVLEGLHLTFNLEAGSLLPLAIKFVVLETIIFTNYRGKH